MDAQPQRYESTLTALTEQQEEPRLIVERFSALSPDRAANNMSCVSSVATDKTLGCALSHRALAAKIWEDEDVRSGECLALVLEDDVYPAVPNLYRELERVASRLKRDDRWDIVLLNTAGLDCNVSLYERPGRMCGSTAAYLLSWKGAAKMMGSAVSWHCDIVRNTDFYNVQKGPSLFATRDCTPSGVIVGDRDIVWYAQQPCFRLLGVALTLSAVVALMLVLVFLIAVAAKLSSDQRNGSLLLAIPSSALLALMCAVPWYCSRDINYLRISKDTSCLLALIAMLFIASSSASLARGVQPATSVISLFLGFVVLMLTFIWTVDMKKLKRKE